MFESQLIQMPGPRDIVIYWSDPRAFSVVQKPRGWAHISVQKPRGARVTGQIDTCIIGRSKKQKFFEINFVIEIATQIQFGRHLFGTLCL